MEQPELRVSVILDQELMESLDKFAVKHRLSRSDAVRLALRKVLFDGHGVIKLE